MNHPAMPLVSVIVVNYNGLRFLQTCFDALAAGTYPQLEQIMVDNGSTDESVSFVEQNYPRVRIIRSASNLSFSGGNNLGVRHAQGKYVVLLNNDTEVTPGWLEPLIEELESDEQIAACQPKVLSMIDRRMFEYAGAAGGFLDSFGFPFLRGRLFTTIEEDLGQYQAPVDLFWTSGTAMAIRKEVLDETGMLDEDFVLHMEEIDLCWRLHLHGYRLRVRPDAVIYHFGGGTLGPERASKMYYNHRNSIFMLLKNYSLGRLLRVLPVRLLLDFVLVLKSLLTLDVKRLGAVVAGYFWLAFHPRLIWRKRQAVQAGRKVPDQALDPYFYHGSLVLAYYLLRRKTYREIIIKAD